MVFPVVIKTSTYILGYLYPAYECFKALERGKSQKEKLRFWCRYWILMAIITVFEKIADPLLSWFPLYHEMKLTLIISLWHPKTEGANQIYNQVFLPFITKYEPDIDKGIRDLREKVSELFKQYVQASIQYGKAMFMESLAYLASQAPRNQTQGVSGAPATVPQSNLRLEPNQWEFVEPQNSNSRFADLDEDEDIMDYDVVESFSQSTSAPAQQETETEAMPPGINSMKSPAAAEDSQAEPITQRLRSRSRTRRTKD